jgi:toxin FitB
VRADLAARFEDRLLPINASVTQRWGMLAGESERKGQPLPVIDSLIAATALTHNLTVVSRNAIDFERRGVKCVNPWNG